MLMRHDSDLGQHAGFVGHVQAQVIAGHHIAHRQNGVSLIASAEGQVQ
jgi:hypothetical protein